MSHDPTPGDATPTTDGTVGEHLGACLRAVGATRVFGAGSDGIVGIPGLGHVRVEEPALAALLADAAGRLGPGPGVALLPGRRLRLSSVLGGVANEVVLGHVDEVAPAVATWDLGRVHASVELVLELDLEAPAPSTAEPLVYDPRSAGGAVTLDPALAEARLAILAGPGVVRDGAVGQVAVVAERTGLPVLNTWGAKGLFRWDSPYHAGTAGLQAEDFALAGLAEAEIVLAIGVDPAEAPAERWAGPQVLEVEPWQLDTLVLRWPDPGPPAPTGRNRLYESLAAALAGPYESDAVPLSPARAARDLAAAANRGALVTADPGPAGLWVARALPTTEPGSVVVPATRAPGAALALALVAGLDQRTAFAVTTEPFDATTEALVQLGLAWHSPTVVVAWGADVELPAADAHLAALRAARRDGGPQLVGVPVALEDTRLLVEVAGPVVAWSD